MKYLGSKLLRTTRLELRPQTMKEQHYLWQLLVSPQINEYYLTVPKKFREKLKIWEIQKQYYIEEMKHANDQDTFKWSIYLKDTNQCIGRITCHEAHDEDEQINDPDIRGVGWFIDPSYQKMGYATEAASKMIDYMFNECEIKEIRTSAAMKNISSWKIMEKLNFIRLSDTLQVQYTYQDESTQNYQYLLTRKMYEYLNQDIDHPKYLFHGSPKKLSILEPKLAHDSNNNKNNIATAIFLFPSFLKSTPYAFKDTIKNLSTQLDWNFEIPNNDTYPLMIMENVNISDDITGYVYVFLKNDTMIKDKNTYQYKYYQKLTPIDVVEVKYKDYKKYYKLVSQKTTEKK